MIHFMEIFSYVLLNLSLNSKLTSVLCYLFLRKNGLEMTICKILKQLYGLHDVLYMLLIK